MTEAITGDKMAPLAPSVKTLVLPELAVKLALGAKTSTREGEVLVFFEDDALRVHGEDFSLAEKVSKRLRFRLPHPSKLNATALLSIHATAHQYVTEEVFRPGALRVLYYPAKVEASSFYRCRLPADALNRGDRVTAHVTYTGSAREALDYDVVALQIDASPAARQFAKSLQEMGKKVIFEIDDAFDALEPWHPRYEFYSRPTVRQQIKSMMEIADAVTVTTKALADRFVDQARRVGIIPNLIPLDMWPRTSPHDTEEFRILWAGSPSHVGDLGFVADTLWRFAQLHSDVRLVFFGSSPKGMPKEIEDQVTILPFASFLDYPERLASAQADVAIAPLADIEFNVGKSPIKLLEYGACGYPVIASNVGPYKEYGALYTTLCTTPTDWQDALSLARASSDWRKMMASRSLEMARKFDVIANTKLIEDFFTSL